MGRPPSYQQMQPWSSQPRLLSSVIRSPRAVGEDDAIAHPAGSALHLMLADGATGAGEGNLAAAYAMARMTEAMAAGISEPEAMAEALSFIDLDLLLELEGPETTALWLVLEAGTVRGAAVGDTEAWLFGGQEPVAVTAAVPRRPRLGTGRTRPGVIPAMPCRGILVAATDGLFGYVAPEEIGRELAAAPHRREARHLADLVERRYAGLPDDIAILVAQA